MIKRFDSWLLGQGLAVQIAVFYMLLFVPELIYMPIAAHLGHIKHYEGSASYPRMIFVLVILAPLIETLICQLLVFKILNSIKSIQQRPMITVISSSIIFGLQHYLSKTPVLLAFLYGLVLAYAFNSFLPDYRKAFWSVVLIHAMKNLSTMILME